MFHARNPGNKRGHQCSIGLYIVATRTGHPSKDPKYVSNRYVICLRIELSKKKRNRCSPSFSNWDGQIHKRGLLLVVPIAEYLVLIRERILTQSLHSGRQGLPKEGLFQLMVFTS